MMLFILPEIEFGLFYVRSSEKFYGDTIFVKHFPISTVLVSA